MHSKIFKRRAFLKIATFNMTGFYPLLNSYAVQRKAPFYSVGSSSVLRDPDDNGVMLPEGFNSRIVARSGQAPIDYSAYIWHSAPDGGACFETKDGGWIYVSNSEAGSHGGGVGALRFNEAGEKLMRILFYKIQHKIAPAVRHPGKLGYPARNLTEGRYLNVTLTENPKQK